MPVLTRYGKVEAEVTPLGDNTFLVAEQVIEASRISFLRLAVGILERLLKDAVEGCGDPIVEPLHNFALAASLASHRPSRDRMAIRVAAHAWAHSANLDPWAELLGTTSREIRQEMYRRLRAASDAICPLGPGQCLVHDRKRCLVAVPHKDRIAFDLLKMEIPSILAMPTVPVRPSLYRKPYDRMMLRFKYTPGGFYYVNRGSKKVDIGQNSQSV